MILTIGIGARQSFGIFQSKCVGADLPQRILSKKPLETATSSAQAGRLRVGMKPQAVSNQLQRLLDKGILSNVRSGMNIHYRIVDPCIMDLLDQGLCLTEDTWKRRSPKPARALPATA